MANRFHRPLAKRWWRSHREWITRCFRLPGGQGVGEDRLCVRQTARQPHDSATAESAAPTLDVPDHTEVAKGTLRAIVRQAGLTVEEFNDLL
jgi:hypothetical protein